MAKATSWIPCFLAQIVLSGKSPVEAGLARIAPVELMLTLQHRLHFWSAIALRDQTIDDQWVLPRQKDLVTENRLASPGLIMSLCSSKDRDHLLTAGWLQDAPVGLIGLVPVIQIVTQLLNHLRFDPLPTSSALQSLTAIAIGLARQRRIGADSGPGWRMFVTRLLALRLTG